MRHWLIIDMGAVYNITTGNWDAQPHIDKASDYMFDNQSMAKVVAGIVAYEYHTFTVTPWDERPKSLRR